MSCDVCRGSKKIRLPIWPELRFSDLSADVPAREETIHYREFNCPACVEQVPFERIATVKAMVDLGPLKRVPEERRQEIARRDAARRIADFLVSKDLMIVEERDGWPLGDRRIRYTVGIVSRKHVAELEDRVAERQFEVAEAVVAATTEEIANWGSFYHGRMGGRVDASQAVEWLQTALRKVRERVKRPKVA